MQAASGLADLQRVVAGEPRYLPTIIADKVTGLHAAFAVVNAVVHRTRTGRGQQISVPMFETLVAFNMLEHLWGHAFDPPKGPMGYEPVSKAARRPFATRDGHMCFLPYLDRHWKRFLELVGEERLTDDPRFGTFQGRQQNQELVWSEVRRQAALKTTQEWVQILQREDIPFAVVASLEDLVDDPQLEATGFWSFMEHPTEGTLRMPGIPIEMADSAPCIRRPPPRLGEHTEQVLREHGFVDDEILGVIRSHGDAVALDGGA
jgi:crotonobetainyl-CoA:carnitine CoA-transferase CaiB-like acyl-CoA transferase